MKIIEVPTKEITVKTPLPGGGEQADVVPFKKFLVHNLDNFTGVKTTAQVRQVQKIVDQIEAGNGTITLEDADYQVLEDALKEKHYITSAVRQLFPYYDAAEKAQDVKAGVK